MRIAWTEKSRKMLLSKVRSAVSNGDSILSDILNVIRYLIRTETVRVSEHGYDELAEDGLTVKELLDGIDKAKIVEEYPDYPKGSCILLLQEDKHNNPVHVLWGIPKGYNGSRTLK